MIININEISKLVGRNGFESNWKVECAKKIINMVPNNKTLSYYFWYPIFKLKKYPKPQHRTISPGYPLTIQWDPKNLVMDDDSKIQVIKELEKKKWDLDSFDKYIEKRIGGNSYIGTIDCMANGYTVVDIKIKDNGNLIHSFDLDLLAFHVFLTGSYSGKLIQADAKTIYINSWSRNSLYRLFNDLLDKLEISIDWMEKVCNGNKKAHAEYLFIIHNLIMNK